jgi:hypothetical protein
LSSAWHDMRIVLTLDISWFSAGRDLVDGITCVLFLSCGVRFLVRAFFFVSAIHISHWIVRVSWLTLCHCFWMIDVRLGRGSESSS